MRQPPVCKGGCMARSTLGGLDELGVFALPVFGGVAENGGFIGDFRLLVKLLRGVVACEARVEQEVSALDAKPLQLLNRRAVWERGARLEDGLTLEGGSLGERVVGDEVGLLTVAHVIGAVDAKVELSALDSFLLGSISLTVVLIKYYSFAGELSLKISFTTEVVLAMLVSSEGIISFVDLPSATLTIAS